MAGRRYQPRARQDSGGLAKITLGRPPRLTLREAQVLKLTAEGLSTKEIADVFVVSHQAVDYHVRNLLSKFCCDKRTGMVARAFVLGYLDPEAWPPKLIKRE